MSRSGRRGYRYRMLEWFGAISTTMAIIVAALGGLIAIALLATVTEDTAAANIAMAVGVGLATFMSAVSIAVAADVVQWMRDVVDLLDEQVEAVDASIEGDGV